VQQRRGDVVDNMPVHVRRTSLNAASRLNGLACAPHSGADA
jgi:hypothetical protein